MNKPKVALFGASEGGSNVLINYKHDFNFVAFIDNDKKKQGTMFAGLPVIAPEEIDPTQIDEIIISSLYGPQIHSQLMWDLSVPKDVIIRRLSIEHFETNWRRELAAFLTASASLLGILAGIITVVLLLVGLI